MTDAELIARLRSMHWCVTTEANGVGVSDSKVALEGGTRIEALIAERDEAYRLFAFWRAEADRLTEHNGRACVRAETAEDRIEELEAKLAKAVEALDDIVKDCEADYPPSHGAIKHFAIATLAEIKGESHE